MAVTSWSKQVFDEMEIVVKTYGINTFKHFMAYKGALMVNDDELYNSFARCAELGALPLVHAENGDVVARMQEPGGGETGNAGPDNGDGLDALLTAIVTFSTAWRSVSAPSPPLKAR